MDFATLGVRVDSQGVKEGTADLHDLTKAAGSAENAAEKLKRTTMPGAGGGFVGPPMPPGWRKPIDDSTDAMVRGGLSAKQYSQAMRQVPMQLTDIVTGLVSGQPAYMVAIQQGGQLRDVFGGFGNAARALGTILTPTRLLIGAIGAAITVAATAFAKGQAEGFEFAKAIALTGNAAGTSSGQLRGYAQEIDNVIGTEANAAEVLAKLASTGRVANDQLREVAQAAVQLQKVAGVAIEQTIKEFAALGDKPTEASAKLNQQYNYLSISQLRNIRELEETGRLTEAAALAQEIYADAIASRIPELEQNLGALQRAAKATGGFFAEMWDSVLAIGREETPAERFAEIRQEISRLDTFFLSTELQRKNNPNKQRRRDELQAELDAAQGEDRLAKLQAQGEAERLSFVRSMAEKEAEEMRKRQERLRQAAAEAEQIRKAQLAAELSTVQRALTAEIAAYDNQATELEAQRSARLITDQEYYEKRKQLIEASTAASISALNAENVRLKAEKLTGADAIQRQDRIKENEAEIARLRAAQISQVRVLGIELGALNQRTEQYYKTARAAAEADLKAQQQQYSRDLAGQSLGRRQQQFDSGFDEIDDRFLEKRQQLEARRHQITQEQYDQELAIIEEFHDESIEAYLAYWKQLTEAQGSWANGAKAALRDYLDEAKNVADATYEALSGALKRGEDALLDFIMTGKLGWKEFANDAIREILRIQLQAQLANLFGLLGMLGGGAAAGAGSSSLAKWNSANARAGGGDIEPNVPYLVGEKGPEMRVFNRAGSIVPNHKLSGGAVTIQQTNHFAAGVDQAALMPFLSRMRDETVNAARAAVQEDALRGRDAWSRV